MRIVTIDEQFEGRRAPTIVKLDVEGVEKDALLGAQSTVSRHGPLLAVSVYHRPSDLWTLPLLMSRLAPSSRIVLRHYTGEFDDTVCYAVPPWRR